MFLVKLKFSKQRSLLKIQASTKYSRIQTKLILYRVLVTLFSEQDCMSTEEIQREGCYYISPTTESFWLWCYFLNTVFTIHILGDISKFIGEQYFETDP